MGSSEAPHQHHHEAPLSAVASTQAYALVLHPGASAGATTGGPAAALGPLQTHLQLAPAVGVAAVATAATAAGINGNWNATTAAAGLGTASVMSSAGTPFGDLLDVAPSYPKNAGSAARPLTCSRIEVGMQLHAEGHAYGTNGTAQATAEVRSSASDGGGCGGGGVGSELDDLLNWSQSALAHGV